MVMKLRSKLSMTKPNFPEVKSASCISCALKINDGPGLRCGVDYFRTPALERRAPKLTSFPEVAHHHVCEKWIAVVAPVLKQITEPVQL